MHSLSSSLDYAGQSRSGISENVSRFPLRCQSRIRTSYLASTSEFLDLSERSTLFLNAFEDRSVMLEGSREIPCKGCAILVDARRSTDTVGLQNSNSSDRQTTKDRYQRMPIALLCIMITRVRGGCEEIGELGPLHPRPLGFRLSGVSN